MTDVGRARRRHLRRIWMRGGEMYSGQTRSTERYIGQRSTLASERGTLAREEVRWPGGRNVMGGQRCSLWIIDQPEEREQENLCSLKMKI